MVARAGAFTGEERRNPGEADVLARIDALDQKVVALAESVGNLTANMRILSMVWGIDISQPQTVADAMSARPKQCRSVPLRLISTE